MFSLSFSLASEGPVSCEELLLLDRTLPSAIYWLSIDGVRVRIFCHFHTDSEPSMYIPLLANEESNYAHNYNIMKPDTCDDTILDSLEEFDTWPKAGFTIFPRVRLKSDPVKFHTNFYIESRPKRHIQTHFLEWKYLCFDSRTTSQSLFLDFHFPWVRIGSSNELAINSSPLTKWPPLSQTTFSNAFSWIKSFAFPFEFHWSFLLRVQLIVRQHSIGSGNGLSPVRRLNQRWPSSLTQKSSTGGRWVNRRQAIA